MRARMAIAASGVQVSLREVLLRDKPPELLAVSPKATVPVLVLTDGSVIEESLDVMQWALKASDPQDWLKSVDFDSDWIQACDGEFKGWLDRYKYADRYPEHPASVYRQHAEAFLAEIEAKLSASLGLAGEAPASSMWPYFPLFGSLPASTRLGGKRHPTRAPESGWRVG